MMKLVITACLAEHADFIAIQMKNAGLAQNVEIRRCAGLAIVEGDWVSESLLCSAIDMVAGLRAIQKSWDRCHGRIEVA